MKKLTLLIALVALVAAGNAAFAVIGATDDVPAATLLLPYFEVDFNSPNGVTTLFSINNASAVAALAHVTFWTDESVPTLDFDIYLTGYDVQTINIRDIFNGLMPVTADDNSDVASPSVDSPGPLPANATSNQGALSLPDLTTGGVAYVHGDAIFPGSQGPCVTPSYPAGLPSDILAHFRALHTGGKSLIYNFCGGYAFGDNIARGYVTVDLVTRCSTQFPADAGYFTSTTRNDLNMLWGDYFYVDEANNYAMGETLVHLEVRDTVAPTFYERYNGTAGEDFRESLPNVFATRYINGGTFSGGTDLIVWRDSEVATDLTGFKCGENAAWFPLAQRDVVGFDEKENPEDLCFLTNNDVSPPITEDRTCFPLEAQRVNVETGNDAADPINPTAPFGWLYLNLEHTANAQTDYPGQAWVTTVMSAAGRFSVGYDAIVLSPPGTSQGALIP